MRDSPCHYCTKRPCFVHDTCPDYLEFRAEIDKETAKRVKEDAIIGYTCRSLERVNKKKWRSKRK